MNKPQLKFVRWHIQQRGESKGYWAIIWPRWRVDSEPFPTGLRTLDAPMFLEAGEKFTVDCPICDSPKDFRGAIYGASKASLRDACVAHWVEKHLDTLSRV